MTHPTPLSTAGSAEDLLRRARAGCAFQFVGDGSDNQEVDTVATNSLLEELADEIERLRERNSEHEHRYDALEARLDLRQPVAGDASDLVKALEDTVAVIRCEIGGFAQIKGILDEADAALTRHRQGEKA